MSKFMRIIAMSVLVVFATGCIGQFALTKKVYDWNLKTGEGKWVDELLFLVLGWIPVYGIAVWIDAVIINSVEFWTGTNPVSEKAAVVGQTRRIQGQDGGYADMTLQADNSIAVVTFDAAGEQTAAFTLHKGEDSITAKSMNGDVLASASVADLQVAM